MLAIADCKIPALSPLRLHNFPRRRHGHCRHGLARGWLALVVLLLAGLTVAQQLDLQFAPGFDDAVYAIAAQAGGTIIVGGSFYMVSGQVRYALARLHADGTLLPALPAGPDREVRAVAVDASGRILIGGNFFKVGSTPANLVARLLSDGSLDTGFVSGLLNSGGGQVESVATQSNGKIVVAGRLTTSAGSADIVRLNANGSVDTSFNPPALHPIVAMIVLPDDRIIVSAQFEQQNDDCDHYCVMRLQADGSLDSSFAMTQTDADYIALQRNGRILFAGGISHVDDHVTDYVGRIMPNGGADSSFTNNALRYANPYGIQEQIDGTILIAGEWRWGSAGPRAVDRVARLHSSGARDTSFNEPEFDSSAYAMYLSPNSEVILGGLFETVNATARTRMARLIFDRPGPVFSNGFE